MDIIFSRKINGEEHGIIITRGSDLRLCNVQISGRDEAYVVDCSVAASCLRYFNASPTLNRRDDFYNLIGINDRHDKSIARIVGMLYPYGHYFEVLSHIRIVEDFIQECFDEYMEGTAVCDLLEIAEESNRAIFVTDRHLNEKYAKDFKDLYDRGCIGRISMETERAKHECYWIETRDVDFGMASFVELRKIVIRKTNSKLKRRTRRWVRMGEPYTVTSLMIR